MNSEQNKKVYLVDGSGYIFRAYYAVSANLSTRDGFPTNALYGFLRMLLKLLAQADSEHVFMVFDAGRETFRMDLYHEYKANRQECPQDLSVQMPFFREFSTALGLQVLELKGFEADDIIGTLAARFAAAGIQAEIISADKDLMQLVGDHVSMWDTMRDKRYGREQVFEKFGVFPEKVVDFLALTGDSSDNVPGMKGVGPKTAAQLIEKYGDIEGILSSADKILEDASIRSRKKIAAQIESEAQLVRLSKQLVEIRLDAPVELVKDGTTMQISQLSDIELYQAALRRDIQQPHLSELVDRFEFRSVVNEFGLHGPHHSQSGGDYQTITRDSFDSWLEELKTQPEFSFDLETTSLDPLEAEIVGAAFCWDNEKAFYLPISHRDQDEQFLSGQISLETFKGRLGPRLSDPKQLKLGQNLKYDMRVLLTHGIELEGVGFDTLLAAYLLQPEGARLNLESLASHYLGRSMLAYEEVTAGLSDFSRVSIERATAYAAEDAHIAWLLKIALEEKLREHDLLDVFNQVELPLMPVLARIEQRGICLDRDFLAGMSAELELRLNELTGQIYAVAGSEFNINSPKQLSEVMFEQLGISSKGIKKTKIGFSTNSAVLESLQDQHPLPRLILEYRGLHKLKSTYVDALPVQVSQKTGRLHTRLNQTITATGRLSSSDPNLQNIPIQTAEGRRVRKAFVSDVGKLLISADYSQIELRVLAHMSEDQNLIQSFVDGQDIHSNTAREILGLSASAPVSAEQRRIGKTINFGIVYGMSGFRLARDLEIPVGVANEYIENYFSRYPGVRLYFNQLEQQIDQNGEVCTLFGRKRFVQQIDSSGRDRGFVRRAAMNAPLQGTAADIIKLAMIKLDHKIRSERVPAQMLLQIHDELLFSCDQAKVEEVSRLIKSQMESVVNLKVPLVVELGVGKNWQEAH